MSLKPIKPQWSSIAGNEKSFRRSRVGALFLEFAPRIDAGTSPAPGALSTGPSYDWANGKGSFALNLAEIGSVIELQAGEQASFRRKYSMADEDAVARIQFDQTGESMIEKQLDIMPTRDAGK